MPDTWLTSLLLATLFGGVGGCSLTKTGSGNWTTTMGIPFMPADYAAVQANANIGSTGVGAVIYHTHLYTNTLSAGTNSNASFGSNPNLQYGITRDNATTASTGGSANLAAGIRVLKCLKYMRG